METNPIPIKAALADQKKVVKVFAFIEFKKPVGLARIVGVAMMVAVAAAAAVAGSLYSFFCMKSNSKAENVKSGCGSGGGSDGGSSCGSGSNGGSSSGVDLAVMAVAMVAGGSSSSSHVLGTDRNHWGGAVKPQCGGAGAGTIRQVQ